MRFIEEFRESELVLGHYLCKQKQLMKSKFDKEYISLKLQDKTGIIEAKVWELNGVVEDFNEKDFVKVEATVQLYNGSNQLNVKKIRKSKEDEYDIADYIPSTKKNIDEMYNELIGLIQTIENVYVKQLLEKIFFEHEDVSVKIKTHSAAKSMHHNYLGGLIEHTLSITQICSFLANHYPTANRDILICTAMLHDVAKIIELSDFPENDYTDEGQLLGHIFIGAELIGKTASTIDGFPKTLENLLKHSILGHHGQLDYGSPKIPATIEAFILSCADSLDAKVKTFEDAVESIDESKGNWLGYNRMLERYVRNSKF